MLAWCAVQAIANWPQRQKPNPRLATEAIPLLALTLSACGGGSSGSPIVHNSGTPVGTYSLAVTATYGTGSTSVHYDLNLTLTVQ
jgi:hypothetical protein